MDGIAARAKAEIFFSKSGLSLEKKWVVRVTSPPDLGFKAIPPGPFYSFILITRILRIFFGADLEQSHKHFIIQNTWQHYKENGRKKRVISS
jgi:hypothetical protein